MPTVTDPVVLEDISASLVLKVRDALRYSTTSSFWTSSSTVETRHASTGSTAARAPRRSPEGTGPSPPRPLPLSRLPPSTRDSAARPSGARSGRRRTSPTAAARRSRSGGRRASRPAWRRGRRSRLPLGRAHSGKGIPLKGMTTGLHGPGLLQRHPAHVKSLPHDVLRPGSQMPSEVLQDGR